MKTALLVLLGLVCAVAFVAALAATGFKILKGTFRIAYELSKTVIGFVLLGLGFLLLLKLAGG